jgi:predicted RNA-binding protein Jag
MTLDSTNFKKMKKEVEEFFKQMTFDVEIELLPQRDQTLPVNLKTENPQILIGERGETLLDIQHLLKAILKRKAGIKELFYVDLDINDYKK